MVPSRGRRDGECGVLVCVCVFGDETLLLFLMTAMLHFSQLSLQMLQFGLRQREIRCAVALHSTLRLAARLVESQARLAEFRLRQPQLVLEI